MVVEDIWSTGLEKFIVDLLAIDKKYKELGKSDESSNNADGRARLTSKSDSILNQISIYISLSDLTLFDIDIIHQSGVDLIARNMPNNDNIMAISKAIDISESNPEVYDYFKESNAISKSMDRDFKDVSWIIQPIGHKKFSGTAIFKGTQILGLFNGFLENSIYQHFTDDTKLEDGMKKVYGDIYVNFINLVMKTYYHEFSKTGLVEDYMNEVNYFSYIKKENNDDISIAKIVYPYGEISFFGEDVDIRSSVIKYKNDYNDKKFNRTKETTLYYAASIPLYRYLMMKNFSMLFKVVAVEPYQVVFNEPVKLKLPKEVGTVYANRLTELLQHNIEARNLMSMDEKLKHPSTLYNMILAGSHIKVLFTSNLFKDIDTSNLPEYDKYIVNLINPILTAISTALID